MYDIPKILQNLVRWGGLRTIFMSGTILTIDDTVRNLIFMVLALFLMVSVLGFLQTQGILRSIFLTLFSRLRVSQIALATLRTQLVTQKCFLPCQRGPPKLAFRFTARDRVFRI